MQLWAKKIKITLKRLLLYIYIYIYLPLKFQSTWNSSKRDMRKWLHEKWNTMYRLTICNSKHFLFSVWFHLYGYVNPQNICMRFSFFWVRRKWVLEMSKSFLGWMLETWVKVRTSYLFVVRPHVVICLKLLSCFVHPARDSPISSQTLLRGGRGCYFKDVAISHWEDGPRQCTTVVFGTWGHFFPMAGLPPPDRCFWGR